MRVMHRTNSQALQKRWPPSETTSQTCSRTPFRSLKIERRGNARPHLHNGTDKSRPRLRPSRWLHVPTTPQIKKSNSETTLRSCLDARPYHSHMIARIRSASFSQKVTHLKAYKTKKVTHLGALLSPSSGDTRKGQRKKYLLTWPRVVPATAEPLANTCRHNTHKKQNKHPALKSAT